ncbi:helix-turn-helix domain-containing protein [Micromonospora sp. CPCC 206061]|uniref:helix-turn-helix domain-containing protein n=1 Tax=Micromonospora sp. CPCC 206061 TaxID=3122410 RepID=UPI002FF063D9
MTVAPTRLGCTVSSTFGDESRRATPGDLPNDPEALRYELFTVRLSPRPRIRLDRSGTHEYTERRRPAVAPTCPHAVYLTDAEGQFRLLCFDLDASAGQSVVGEDLARLCTLLDTVAISYVVARSGPGGGYHVWLRLRERVGAAVVRRLAQALAAVLPSLDTGALTNPATGCARPPGALHRHGGRSVLVNPSDPLRAYETLADGVSEGQLQLLFDSLPQTARAAGAAAASRPRGTAQQRIVDNDSGPHLAGQRRALSPSTAALLTAEPAGDASALLWRILLRTAFARWRLADVATLVADPAMTGLEHIRSTRCGSGGRVARGPAEQDALLRRQWRRAVEHAAALPQLVPQDEDGPREAGRAAEVTAAVQRIEAAAEAMPWRWATPAGPADRAALKALCLMALACCSTELALDCRRWSRLTGHGKSTMAEAANRLSRSSSLDGPPWIALVTPAEGTRAAVWRLLPPEPEQQDDATQGDPHLSPVDITRTQGRKPAPQGSDYVPQPAGEDWAATTARLRQELARIAHDVWTPRGGLGHHLERTYSYLLGRPRTVGGLAQITGYSTATIRRHLDILQEHKLAAQQRSGEWKTGRASLDRVADRLGVAGVGRTRHQRYLVDRELHAWWIEEQDWRQRRGKPRKGGPPTGEPPDTGQAAIPLPVGPRTTYGRFPVRRDGRADYTRARAVVAGRLGLTAIADDAIERAAAQLLAERLGATELEKAAA